MNCGSCRIRKAIFAHLDSDNLLERTHTTKVVQWEFLHISSKVTYNLAEDFKLSSQYCVVSYTLIVWRLVQSKRQNMLISS